MYIKSLRYLNKEAQEAELIVTDGIFEILCFSQPFIGAQGQMLSNPLECCFVDDLVLSHNKTCMVVKGEEYFAYTITARLGKEKLAFLGDIKLSLASEYIPGDINEGDYIDFYVGRISFY